MVLLISVVWADVKKYVIITGIAQYDPYVIMPSSVLGNMICNQYLTTQVAETEIHN